MASVKKLTLILEAQGIEPTTKNLRVLNATLSKTKKQASGVSNAANKTKRKLEAVGKTSLSTGKAFSRQAQGMGGLVAAYATIAANVFALSSAFLLLRRAADLSSMQKSAQNFSDRFGVSVQRITMRMQEASGGALDFAEALPSINKAVSAGVGIEQMEQLTIAATKAAQTFGGSTTEALNRFISASQRGRVEIIQTLGVVIKTEQAYKAYAATIGKTALELSAYDRQQAILNATIEASQKVFAGIVIDPNPFTQFASTMIDVKDEILTFITDGITPFLQSFNRSKNAAVALIAVMAAIVAKKIFPQLTEALRGFTAASIKSNIAATAALQKANKNKAKSTAAWLKTSGKQTEKSLRKQLRAEEKSYAKRKTKHASFKESIFRKDGSIDAARLNQQKAALSRQEAILAKGQTKGLQKNLSNDVNMVRKQIDARNRLAIATNALNTSEKQRNATLGRTAALNTKVAASLRQYAATTKAVAIGLRSGIVTGFSKSFATMQSSVLLGFKKMRLAWASFNRSIGKEGVNSLKRFSEAFGRTVGVVAGGLTKLIGLATSLLVLYSLGKLFWEVFGDRIKGISKDQRELLNSFQGLGDTFKEITVSSKKYLANMQGGVLTLSNFIAEAEFLRGTFDTITVAVNDFNTAIFNATGTKTIEELSTFLVESAKTYENLKGDIAKLSNTPTEFRGLGRGVVKFTPESSKTEDLKQLEEITKNLGINIKTFETSLKEVNKISLANVVGSLGTTISLLDQTGLGGFSTELKDKVVENFGLIGKEGKVLSDTFKAGNYIGLIALIGAIEDTGKQAAAIKALAGAYKELGEQGKAVVGNFVSSGRALEETNKSMQIYLSGIEKAKAASVPNKVIFNILLDTARALNDLDKAAKKGTKKKLEDLIGAPDLSTLRTFINLPKDITFDEALKRVSKELLIYDAVILDSINNTGKFKTIANEIFNLKNEEVSTDLRRLDIIEKLEKKAIEKATLDRDTAKHQRIVATRDRQRLQDAKEIHGFQFVAAKALEKTLRAEVIGHQLVIDAIEAKMDKQREYFKIVNESLVSIIGVNKAQLSITKSQRSLSTSTKEYLALGQKIFKLRLQDLGLQNSKKQIELNSLFINKKTLEQDLKRAAVLKAEIDLIKQQTIALKEQQLSREARERESSGEVSIFSDAGIAEAVGFFIKEMQKGVNKLKSSFETLGKGFANTINSTFDAAVDNLLEGGHDFGRAVIETLKEGLRETFGKALKDRIRDSLNTLFSIKKDKPLVDNTSAIKELTTVMWTLTNSGASTTGTNTPSVFNTVASKGTETGTALAGMLDSTIQAMLGLSMTSTNIATNSTTEHVQKLTAEQENTSALKDLTLVMRQSLTKETGKKAAGQALIKSPLFKTGDNSEALGPLKKSSEDQANSVDKLGKTGIEAVEVANAFGALASGDSAALKQSIFSLIPILISGFTSMAASNAFSFGTGGILPGGMGNIKALAAGAVTTGPNLAVIGEGKNNEAVVPLPNNREIPVDLKGAQGDTIMIEQNFDFRNADVNTLATLRQEARAIEQRTFDRVFSEIGKGGKYAKQVGRR